MRCSFQPIRCGFKIDNQRHLLEMGASSVQRAAKMSDLLENRKLISLVIPLFNEEEVFGELSRRLEIQLTTLGAKHRVEVILVDDEAIGPGSRFKFLRRQNSIVKGISFSRNFGHQCALFCGYQLSRGDAVISLDGDLRIRPSSSNR